MGAPPSDSATGRSRTGGRARRPAPTRSRLRAALLLLSLLLPLVPSAGEADAGERWKRRAFAGEYRQALTRWALSDEAAAQRALVSIEAAALATRQPPDLDTVRETELAVVRELAVEGTELLVPVARLHELAYLEHLAAGRASLAVHARTMVEALAEEYAVRGRAPESRRVAAALLASLGAHLQSGYMDATARRLYSRALAHDPESTPALLGRAELAERHGRYPTAVVDLRRLVAIEPDHHAARLRLGVNLLRLGETAEGLSHLGRLLAAEPAEWVLSVAYQETARQLAAEGRAGAAIDRLDEALTRLPGDPTLRIQRAYLADRFAAGGGRPPDPGLAAALRRRASAGSGGNESPRLRYSRMSREAFAALRAELDDGRPEERQRLATALEVEPSRPRDRASATGRGAGERQP